MHLIVTHDNADFDAVASLLGALKLYPGAQMLLPNRLNRNVRDFLHLYWDELPFVWPHNLPQECVTRLTMVDTQHVPPIRGLDRNTQYQVIDHHAQSPNLPAGTLVTQHDAGATATLLVEEIKNQSINLTPNEASFLLLGVYEDTGSLLYSSTTTRDVYAAGWLLEQGAALEVVRQFLKYPLSESQQTLYKQLTDALESHPIEGHVIMIAAASADSYVEEISTLAHKLCDLFEPDALFLLVAMVDHIQVVARSTDDAIDVGAITGHLGGGGHSRAAAALIHHSDLAQVHGRLLQLLPQYVRPSITVADIMSHGVHTLAPGDTVSKAARMMSRYGHEGFPVVEDGHIVGVLTRREIDKAMHHKLGGSAISQVMRKGQFYVTPRDSVETLQVLMTREGLGQVPVVEGDKITGIVTRTDLIKLWSESPLPARAEKIAERLRAAMPPAMWQLLRDAGRIAAEQNAALFIVGGFVRDLLHRMDLGLAMTYPDIDLVVEGDAIRLARELAERYGGQVRSHQRFGTAKWLLPEGLRDGISGFDTMATRDGSSNAAQVCPVPETAGQPAALDFVTARMEFYEHPSALPEVERSSIKQDLHRRDFTINTLAIRLQPEHFGEVLDFYGGESDLRQGLIRVLHSLSFVEDPTRILRAIRLEQRVGFRIESRTLELLEHALDLLDRVSGERIYHELHLILCEPEPERALRRLDELGVLRQINPELQADEWVMDRVTDLRRGLVGTPWERTQLADVHFLGILAFRLALTALEPLISRLRIPGYEVDTLRQVELLSRTRLPRLQEPLRPSQIYALLSTFGSNALLIAWLGSSDETVRAQLAEFQRDLRGVQPIIDGNYLRSTFQLRPGPIFRRVLDGLRGARLDGLVVTLTDEHNWVECWMKARANDNLAAAPASDEVPTSSREETLREERAGLPHASCPDVPPTGQ